MLILAYTLSVILMIVIPILLAAIHRRRFVTPWLLFCVGMATFTASQVVHLPLNSWLADLGILPHAGRAEMPPLWQMALVMGLTAGLCEELARTAGYALLKRYRAFGDAVMMGLGHSGIESIVFGGVLTAASVSALIPLAGSDLSSLKLPPEQLANLQNQIQILISSPWLAVMPLLERLLAIGYHVVLSLIVWQAFVRRNAVYVVLAIVYHTAVDAAAVYLGGVLENAWLHQAGMLVMLIPGLVWLGLIFPRKDSQTKSHASPLAVDWAVFRTALGKELLQQWRTKRVLVTAAVFGLFGMLSPLGAYFLPEVFKAIPGVEQFAALIPKPTTVDAMAQYIKNISQFGFLIALLLGMSAVAGEKERGVVSLVLSKPMTRWAFVVSKFVAQSIVYLGGFILALIGAYFYTVVLFGSFDFGTLAIITGLLFVWLLPYCTVTLLGSVIGGTTSAAAGVAVVGAILLLVLGYIPQYGTLLPGGLVAWASQIGAGTSPVSPNGGALAGCLALTVVGLITAVAIFERQEL